MRKLFLLSLFFLLMIPVITFAQAEQPEMADMLRKEGKIYVVVMVLATIFAGIILFLIRLDRKISKLEKNK